MLLGKHVTVVLPAYNAEITLRRTYAEIPHGVVDRVILVDDHSGDNTVAVAKQLGVEDVIVHESNKGYGANQKTCYRRALELGTDIVVMLHPDYQYSPKLVAAMAAMVASEHYDLVLGSRIISEGPLKGGMPLYKYLANRVLTFLQNIALGLRLSEYHTGFRAYSSRLLETIPFAANKDSFVFDNQVIVQSRAFGFRIGEISCPAKYFPEASSITLVPSAIYGCGVLWMSLQFVLARMGFIRPVFLEGPISKDLYFSPEAKKQEKKVGGN
jgi:glycosyltransferase involved in cell wall biosynthesis